MIDRNNYRTKRRVNYTRSHSTKEQIERIYKNVASETTLIQRPLRDFWKSYANYLKTTQNLDHSRSQNEYWDWRKKFVEFVKKNEQKKIGWNEFQPPLPSTVLFLQTMAKTLVEEKLGLHSYGHVVLLIGQLALNIAFITRQFIDTLDKTKVLDVIIDSNHTSNAISFITHNSTHQEYLTSATGLVLNKGIEFQNLVIVLQKIATFSLFKFIHYMKPSTFITEFHDPPFIDTATDFVKFTISKPEWERNFRKTHKILYSLLARPLLILLGLIALYVKLLQVTSSLQWFQSLSLTNHLIDNLYQNPSHVLSFLGLANNIAGLYGLEPEDDRTMFFEHVRVHEYDFLHALLSGFMREERQYWIGYWQIMLYSVAIKSQDLNEAFWESVYGETADRYDNEENRNGVTGIQAPFTESPTGSDQAQFTDSPIGSNQASFTDTFLPTMYPTPVKIVTSTPINGNISGSMARKRIIDRVLGVTPTGGIFWYY
ncbi:9576_t:CDS:2 [Ambispora gerdemannii]|uniref:9576_t:CDS:1 n=1 Tax=Ambispora gerdemannii TaxID=144530 RepID=A0A9N9EW47_9GLOM|nr:9576_t:CDS:2 [Ambispora gerdemannii]